MGRSRWIILVLAAVAIAVGALALSPASPTPGIVDSAEFARLQKQGVRIVDVRTSNEYAAGHIPGAENVALSSFAAVSKTWDPLEPVALYCATGVRSAEAAEMLKARGFKAVYDLSGGIVAWSGPITGGAGTAQSAPSQAAIGEPVMYEFYTDW